MGHLMFSLHKLKMWLFLHPVICSSWCLECQLKPHKNNLQNLANVISHNHFSSIRWYKCITQEKLHKDIKKKCNTMKRSSHFNFPEVHSFIFFVVWSPNCVQLFVTHGLQYTRLLCLSPSPGVCPSSCPLNWWCHPTISSSVSLFSFCPQSFPASGVLSNESGVCIKWSKYWSFSIRPSKEYSGLTSFKIDWSDLAFQGTLKSL